MHVGGREAHSTLSYSRMHPNILHGKHPITSLINHYEHIRLLHASSTLLTSIFLCRFSIVGVQKTVRSLACQCITCHRQTTRPQSQMLGQLPLEHVTPGFVFEKIGVDHVGPLYVKYGMVCKTSAEKHMSVCSSHWPSRPFIWS